MSIKRNVRLGKVRLTRLGSRALRLGRLGGRVSNELVSSTLLFCFTVLAISFFFGISCTSLLAQAIFKMPDSVWRFLSIFRSLASVL